jgi:trimethylamine:corrinoid methyltransferase-like protein
MAEVLGHPIRSLPVYVVSPLTIGSESIEAVLGVLDRLDRLDVGNMPSVGATVPISLAEALSLGIAECAGAAFALQVVTQLPVSWSVSAMAFDLRGMAMSFGSPEHRLFCWAAEEVNAFCHGRALGPPSGYAALRTQAKLPGPQAAAEKMAGAMAAAVLGTRDLNGVGALSLDEVFSAEQAIFDCEIRDYVQRFVGGIDAHLDWERLRADVPEALGAGFLSLDSTLTAYQEVYWLPRLSERRSLAGWLAAGQPDLRDRAKALAREYIARHGYHLPDDMQRELERIYTEAKRNLLA